MKQNNPKQPPKPLTLQQFTEKVTQIPLYSTIPPDIRTTFTYTQKQGHDQEFLTKIDHKVIKGHQTSTYYYAIKEIPRCQQILTNQLYVCYSCRTHAEGYMCRACFMEAGHDRGCYTEVRPVPASMVGVVKCCCGDFGKMGYKGTCGSHQQRFQMKPSQIYGKSDGTLLIETEASRQCAAYYTNCWKLLIALSCTFLSSRDRLNNDQILLLRKHIFGFYAKKLISCLCGDGYSSGRSIQFSQTVLLTKIRVEEMKGIRELAHLKEETSVLGVFLQVLPCSLETDFFGMVENLLSFKSELFLRDLVCGIFACTPQNGKIQKLKWLSKMQKALKLQPKFYCTILNQLARDNKIAYQQGYEMQAVKFYCVSSCPEMFLKREDKAVAALGECWKRLLGCQGLGMEFLGKKAFQSLGQILPLTVYDGQLFSFVTKSLIKYLHCQLNPKKQPIISDLQQQDSGPSFNKLFNLKKDKTTAIRSDLISLTTQLIELLYRYHEGQTLPIVKYLRKLELDEELIFVIFNYFVCCLKNSSTMAVNVNYQTLGVFGMYLEMLMREQPVLYEQYQQMYTKHAKHFCSKKFLQFTQKVLQTLITQSLPILSKTLQYKSAPSSSPSTLKLQQAAFKQYLSIRKNIPRTQIHRMLRERTLDFVGAAKIVRENTCYSRESDCFVYNGHQGQQGNGNVLVRMLVDEREAEKYVVFRPEEEDKNFTAYEQKDILMGIFAALLKPKDLQFYKPIPRTQPSEGQLQSQSQTPNYVPLIILDKIFNGKLKQLRSQLYTLKIELYNNYEQEYLMAVWKGTEVVRRREHYLFGVVRQGQEVGNNEKQRSSGSGSGSGSLQEGEKIQQQNEREKQKQNMEGSANLVQVKKVQKDNNKKQQSIQEPTPKIQPVKCSKLLKISQKFKAKQQKILTSLSLSTSTSSSPHIQPLNRQICMICKDHSSPQNSLYYLALLNKDTLPQQMFQSRYRTSYSIQLCMHVMHEKCYLNMCKSAAVFQCPLCKIYSNIVFPCGGELMSARSREFTENRLTYTFVQSFNEYHYESMFTFVLRNLMAESMSYAIFHVILANPAPKDKNLKILKNKPGNFQKSQQQKRIAYYQQFMRQWWQCLEQYQREYYIKKVQKCLNLGEQCCQGQEKEEMLLEMEEKVISNPKDIIDDIIGYAIWGNVCGRDYRGLIGRQLGKLQEIINQSQLRNFMEYVQKYIKHPLKHPKQCSPSSSPFQKSGFIHHFFKPPQPLHELHELCLSCAQCKTQSQSKCWYCLNCNKPYCSSCAHQKVHGNLTAKLFPANGRLQYQDQSGIVHGERIYANSFMQVWVGCEENRDDIFDYRANMELIRRLLSK